MAVYKEIIGNEVYIWMNGQLTMKRWLDRDFSMLFHNSEHPRTKHTYASITEENGEIIQTNNITNERTVLGVSGK